MLSLSSDSILQICRSFSDRDKIRLAAVSKRLDYLTHKFTYYDRIDLEKIVELPYFDNFKHVEVSDLKYKCPKFLTHLMFGDRFNQSVKGYIPGTVTHLTFGHHFNQPIEDCIPISVTHLSFCFRFNQSIDGNIPSVTHLKFGYHFNPKMLNFIPLSVVQITTDRGIYVRKSNSLFQKNF